MNKLLLLRAGGAAEQAGRIQAVSGGTAEGTRVEGPGVAAPVGGARHWGGYTGLADHVSKEIATGATV